MHDDPGRPYPIGPDQGGNVPIPAPHAYGQHVVDVATGLGALSIDEALIDLSRRFPGLLAREADLIARQPWPGAEELARLLRSIDSGGA